MGVHSAGRERGDFQRLRHLTVYVEYAPGVWCALDEAAATRAPHVGMGNSRILLTGAHTPGVGSVLITYLR